VDMQGLSVKYKYWTDMDFTIYLCQHRNKKSLRKITGAYLLTRRIWQKIELQEMGMVAVTEYELKLDDAAMMSYCRKIL